MLGGGRNVNRGLLRNFRERGGGVGYGADLGGCDDCGRPH